MSQIYPANYPSPTAVALYDAASGNALSTSSGILVVNALNYSNACNYTRISTNGTTVVKTGSGVFFGMYVFAAGASSNTVVVCDGTATSTLVLAGTFTNVAAGTQAIFGGLGQIFTTGLCFISTTGTAPVLNVLWD